MTDSCPECGHEVESLRELIPISTGHPGKFYQCPECGNVTKRALWRATNDDD